jgi:hypothetical protein
MGQSISSEREILNIVSESICQCFIIGSSKHRRKERWSSSLTMTSATVASGSLQIIKRSQNKVDKD